ncbi:hypothetical protein [uncultured Brachyspira sp.]|uniref:hypothetical protein n=1 Tax=uncultured Brachyspira sp. TaxID=221953 RepID=UPI0026029A5D|nr:hypothetical protein [uncultured Brachyspira sp.]
MTAKNKTSILKAKIKKKHRIYKKEKYAYLYGNAFMYSKKYYKYIVIMAMYKYKDLRRYEEYFRKINIKISKANILNEIKDIMHSVIDKKNWKNNGLA